MLIRFVFPPKWYGIFKNACNSKTFNQLPKCITTFRICRKITGRASLRLIVTSDWRCLRYQKPWVRLDGAAETTCFRGHLHRRLLRPNSLHSSFPRLSMERELLSFRQGRSYLDVICSSRAFTLGCPQRVSLYPWSTYSSALCSCSSGFFQGRAARTSIVYHTELHEERQVPLTARYGYFPDTPV